MGADAPMDISSLAPQGQNVNPSIFQGNRVPAIVHQPTGPVQVPSRISEGMLLEKTMPAYPVIAKAARREGTVVLQATISTRGTIENLRVLSGDPMLIEAARDAVMNWRYRPYLLNGKPVEVETTVNVVFKLTQ
jgi:protein TonB